MVGTISRGRKREAVFERALVSARPSSPQAAVLRGSTEFMSLFHIVSAFKEAKAVGDLTGTEPGREVHGRAQRFVMGLDFRQL